MRRPPRKALEIALTAVGLLVLLYLVRRIGFAVLWADVSSFGPWFLLTLAIGFGGLLLQATAWWVIQKDFFERVPLSALLRAKIISDGFNLILPSASLGGDAMRAFLLKGRVRLTDGIPAVLFDKTIEFAASVIFLAAVLLLGLLTIRLPTALGVASTISLVVTTAGIALLVAFQKNGMTTLLLRVSRLVPALRSAVERRQGQLLAMDANLRQLYSGGLRRAIVPLAVHVLARTAAGLEFFVVMAVLGAPVTWTEALFMSAVVTVGNTVFFLLPGQWGVMESVHVMVAQSLGYPPAIGLSLGVIRRIRRLAFVALALVLFAARDRPLLQAAEANGTD
jgi:hypothetical protein